MALLDAETVARHIGLDGPGENSGMLTDLVAAAKAAIERECNRTLDATTAYTEYLTAMVVDGVGCVYVDHPPIVADTCPVIYDDWRNAPRLISSADWVRSIDDGGHCYSMGKIQLWNTESFFAGELHNVKITYYGGWTAATLPPDLRRAWIQLVQFWFENPDRVGIAELTEGGYHVAWENAEIPRSLLAVFHAYRVQSTRLG